MTISILPAVEKDIPTLVRVELEAFRDHPRSPILWPNGHQPDVHTFYQSKKIKALRDPQCHLLKAVDVDTGEIIGASEVTFCLDPQKNATEQPMGENEPPPDNWPEGGNWPLRRYFTINSYHLARDSFAGKPYIRAPPMLHLYHRHTPRILIFGAEVDILVVDPEHQGKGIGSKLIQWSIDEADRRGVQLALESSPTGLALYRKSGFVEVERIKADMKTFGWEKPYVEDEAMPDTDHDKICLQRRVTRRSNHHPSVEIYAQNAARFETRFIVMLSRILSGLRSPRSLGFQRHYHEPRIDDPAYAQVPQDIQYEPPRVAMDNLKFPKVTNTQRLSYAEFAHELIHLNPGRKLMQHDVDKAIGKAILERYRLQTRQEVPRYIDSVRRRLGQEAAVFWRVRYGER
ncbi:hypothetical protein AC579_9073 [Pseudocercospora musae]|uniref:N-acetyltransferase domain-containing protein n=1 Tax=Pseudocercospora musae TaxID=113226 RepID=A0A139IFP7_9PEZI|nr:hypothetical protein AC579_9073 [Pseudocercospora musae]